MSTVVCKCGCGEYTTFEKGPHTGARCNRCGSFIKWLPKNGNKGHSSNPKDICFVNAAETENELPEPIPGTEKVQFSWTGTGVLIMRIAGKQYKVYEASEMTDTAHVLIKNGNTAAELLPGTQLNIYVM